MAYTTLGSELGGKAPIGFSGGDGHFIKDVWLGLRPLGETFWRYYFLYFVVFIMGTFLCASLLSDLIASRLPIVLWILSAVAARVWIAVGLWRSATNNPSVWATLVKVIIVLEVLNSVAALVAGMADAMIELDTMSRGRRLNP